MKVPITGNFMINGGDLGFTNRQRELFDQLSQAEKQCNKDQTSAVQLNDLDSNNFPRPPPPGKRRRSETRQFRGKESIFKRPALPSPFADRSIPDHRKNPHKWMKYSLDDVRNDDMSEKSNTTTALSFLNELKARKSKDDNHETKMEVNDVHKNSSRLSICSSSSMSPIVFKKNSNKQNKPDTSTIIVDNNEKAMFRGSKIILPEYVVGQKRVNKLKKEKRKVEKVDRHKQLKLNHLEEFDDDE